MVQAIVQILVQIVPSRVLERRGELCRVGLVLQRSRRMVKWINNLYGAHLLAGSLWEKVSAIDHLRRSDEYAGVNEDRGSHKALRRMTSRHPQALPGDENSLEVDRVLDHFLLVPVC
jgi:hypothetical protein